MASNQEKDYSQLDSLGQALAKKRSEAIAGRLEFEGQWKEDEEFYEGKDEASQSDTSSAWSSKPPGLSDSRTKNSEPRSRVFVNITRPYTDAAASRVADMLLPTDDRNFSLGPTPVPDDISELKKGNLTEQQASIITASLPPEQAAQAVEIAVGNAKKLISEAKRKADKAQARIDDWFVECQFHAEVRKVIEDTARVGTGILKGPFPVKRKVQKFTMIDGVPSIVIKEEIKPASKRISVWDFFPDPACGENIHRGSGVWERDYMTHKMLENLKGLPGYLDDQIDAILEEGPQKATDSSDKSISLNKSKDQFEVWYYHGALSKEDMESSGCPCGEETPSRVNAVITLVNTKVIKASINPLDNGEFPYDVMTWQAISGTWTGVGVPRQSRTPQRIVNSGTRNMMDNAGLSAGGIIVMKLGAVEPADGSLALTPKKLFYVNEGSDIDVDKVFRFIEIPMRQAELQAIIQFGLKLAEDTTGLPMLLQGQQGTAPDTLGGMQMMNNNATGVLRRLARIFDDRITEPHVRRYYNWLLQYGEDDEKGDFQIDARGSSALVERDIQTQAILQMTPIVLNPVFGLNPKLWIKEWLKSQRLTPANFEYTEEELQKLEQQAKQQPPQQDPRVEIATLNAKIEQAKLQNDALQSEKDRELELFIAQMDKEVEAAKIAGGKGQTLDKLKAMLAATALKIKTQKELSAAGMAIDLHKSTRQVTAPPTEPAGRASPGMAFQG